MTDLIKHIEFSLLKTERLESNIELSILLLDGMSGIKTRHFYNMICSLKDARYLEIGSWKGSSICSAMCNNNITCLAIDNWKTLGGPKEEFLKNFNKYKGKNQTKYLEQDCWQVDVNNIGKYNIFLYDGEHSHESHSKVLDYYYPCFDNNFIYLVDDWNFERVRTGTHQSIDTLTCNNKINVLYKKEIFTPSDSNKNEWHNGICIFVIEKCY